MSAEITPEKALEELTAFARRQAEKFGREDDVAEYAAAVSRALNRGKVLEAGGLASEIDGTEAILRRALKPPEVLADIENVIARRITSDKWQADLVFTADSDRKHYLSVHVVVYEEAHDEDA